MILDSKLKEAKSKVLRLQQEVKSLHMRAIDLIEKVEFFKGKLEHAGDKAMGYSI